MSLTNDLYKVYKRRIRISPGMNYKQCVDGSEWFEDKKKTDSINFECERRNVAL